MGIHLKSSDCDLCAIFTSRIERNTFFDEFQEILKSTEGVQNVVFYKNAAIPIIKLTCDGIDFDVITARLDENMIPIDEKSEKAIAGINLAKEISQSVQNQDYRHWQRIHGPAARCDYCEKGSCEIYDIEGIPKK